MPQMARLSGKQSAAARSSSSLTPGKTEPRISFVGITILLLLAILPVALPIYMPSELQHQLLSTLETYLPAQLKIHFSTVQNVSESTNTQQQLSPEQLLEACKVHQYNSQIISLSPLVIYIQNFTSAQEAEELINIGSPDFAESFISRSRGGNQRVTGRTSTSAPLDTSHPLVACILSRARAFMGSMLLPHEPFSTPQLVRYFPGQKYDLHTDFWPEHQVMNDGSNRLFNRVASFFVFLRDNCTGGYTYFPSVEPTGFSAEREVGDEVVERWYGENVKRGEREVGEDVERGGVMFKPIRGNAVFWVNVGEDGVGDRRVVHAGLPVIEGEKIGLNIWPRKFYGRTDGEEERRERKGWSGKWKD